MDHHSRSRAATHEPAAPPTTQAARGAPPTLPLLAARCWRVRRPTIMRRMAASLGRAAHRPPSLQPARRQHQRAGPRGARPQSDGTAARRPQPHQPHAPYMLAARAPPAGAWSRGAERGFGWRAAGSRRSRGASDHTPGCGCVKFNDAYYRYIYSCCN